jgi:hypothetical protein
MDLSGIETRPTAINGELQVRIELSQVHLYPRITRIGPHSHQKSPMVLPQAS